MMDMELTENTSVGPYKLLRPLGVGGMGEVWCAFDPLTGRQVALKYIRYESENSAALSKRFIREIQILAQLDHPGIVRLHTAFVEADRLFCVMEYIEGRSFEILLGQPFQEAQILTWFRQLAAALTYLHAKHVVHRDLKPGNLIADTTTMTARVLDLGVAVKLDQDTRLTVEFQSPHTPLYASPEQLNGWEVDARTDLFSLALSLLAVWSGRAPERGGGALRSMLPPSASPGARQIFSRCLAAKPEQRFASARDLVVELDRLMGRVDPQDSNRKVARISFTPRKWLSWLAASSALVLGLLGIGGIFTHDPDMIRIPSGNFRSGATMTSLEMLPEQVRSRVNEWEALIGRGESTVWVSEFWIDPYEVTNAEYARFVATGGAVAPNYWNGNEPPAPIANHPVVNVTIAEAQSYAQWLDKRLPTALEWEKAARGTAGLLYPWGNEFMAGKTNSEESGSGGTSPIVSHPGDISPYGVFNTGGNVTEWTSTRSASTGESGFVVMGGSWLESGVIVSLTPLHRVGGDGMRYSDVGFRCVR